MRMLSKDWNSDGPRKRKGKDTLKTRWFKRLLGVSEWFRLEKDDADAWEVMDPWVNRGKVGYRKRRTDNRYVESLFMVPHTPGSELKTRITKIESDLKKRT